MEMKPQHMHDEILALRSDQVAEPGIGNCRYSAPCVLGALMTEAERKAIAEAGLDGRGIRVLARHLIPARFRPELLYSSPRSNVGSTVANPSKASKPHSGTSHDLPTDPAPRYSDRSLPQ